MQLQKVIEQLGYSANEAKVYLATLALGEAHVSDIAAKVDLPRTTAQIIVETLQKDGLLNFYVQRRYKYWVAENPERLLSNLRRREEIVRDALPKLSLIRKNARGKRATRRDTEPLALLRMFADASVQPVLITNDQAVIEYVNSAWEAQFGYAHEEVVGQNPRILQSGKTPPEVHTCMWEALRAETMFQSDKIIDKRKDGTFFKLLTTIFPLRHRERLYYIQILNEISEGVQAINMRKQFATFLASKR